MRKFKLLSLNILTRGIYSFRDGATLMSNMRPFSNINIKNELKE